MGERGRVRWRRQVTPESKGPDDRQARSGRKHFRDSAGEWRASNQGRSAAELTQRALAARYGLRKYRLPVNFASSAQLSHRLQTSSLWRSWTYAELAMCCWNRVLITWPYLLSKAASNPRICQIILNFRRSTRNVRLIQIRDCSCSDKRNPVGTKDFRKPTQANLHHRHRLLHCCNFAWIGSGQSKEKRSSDERRNPTRSS